MVNHAHRLQECVRLHMTKTNHNSKYWDLTPQEKWHLNLPWHYNKNLYELIEFFMGKRLMLWLSHVWDLMFQNYNVYTPPTQKQKKFKLKPLTFWVGKKILKKAWNVYFDQEQIAQRHVSSPLLFFPPKQNLIVKSTPPSQTPLMHKPTTTLRT
jgi:hypothetical protein